MGKAGARKWERRRAERARGVDVGSTGATCRTTAPDTTGGWGRRKTWGEGEQRPRVTRRPRRWAVQRCQNGIGEYPARRAGSCAYQAARRGEPKTKAGTDHQARSKVRSPSPPRTPLKQGGEHAPFRSPLSLPCPHRAHRRRWRRGREYRGGVTPRPSVLAQ